LINIHDFIVNVLTSLYWRTTSFKFALYGDSENFGTMTHACTLSWRRQRLDNVMSHGRTVTENDVYASEKKVMRRDLRW